MLQITSTRQQFARLYVNFICHARRLDYELKILDSAILLKSPQSKLKSKPSSQPHPLCTYEAISVSKQSLVHFLKSQVSASCGR